MIIAGTSSPPYTHLNYFNPIDLALGYQQFEIELKSLI